jgi:HNH endonuclease/AP2 domain
MTSLNDIEEFLNIEIGNKRLRNGKKKMNKNTYYWFRNEYYIVNLSNDKWCIMSTNERTRELLTNHVWCCSSGYAITSNDKTTIKLHRQIMNSPENMCIDHINRHPFDNRIDNLRITTHKENMRNKSMPTNNTSSIVGVSKRKKKQNSYWRVNIVDNNNKLIEKSFSIKKFGDEAAKQMAINQRNNWKDQYGYIGD